MNPREMERYNPFAGDQTPPPAGQRQHSFSSQHQSLIGRQDSPTSPGGMQRAASMQPSELDSHQPPATAGLSQMSARYSTSFPDPFGLDDDHDNQPHQQAVADSAKPFATPTSSRQPQQPSSNRSNSVTFLNRIGDRDEDQPPAGGSGRHAGQRGPGRQASGTSGGFTSFLSRATSVTSSSVTDRVSGAVGSVRNAVDSLSSQIQQAVPSPSGLTASNFNQDQQQPTTSGGLLDGIQASKQQQSAASYLASRFSSATNQFVQSATSTASPTTLVGSSAGQQDGQQATICRQRVVLILDYQGAIDWAQQFNQYRRLISGLGPQSSSSSLGFTSFFAAQFSSSSTGGGGSGTSTSQSDGSGSDLIEQVNFKDVSVLANQSSCTAAVYVSGASATAANTSSSSSLPINRLAMNIVGSSSSQQQQQQQYASSSASQQHHHHQLSHLNNQKAKIIRPEYVVVRQRGRERLGHLKSIVKALDYCCVPMFEPFEVWNVFQDRQLIFAKLLRVQKQLGKEQFPLIPQVFCQTHQDLLNYINNSFIQLPCLVRTGPLGKGRIRVDSLQMLKDFATIMATSKQSCTIEQYLDVKCDLIVQKLGTSLKLFKSKFARLDSLAGQNSGSSTDAAANQDQFQQQQTADSTNSGDIFGQQQQRSSITGQDQSSSFGRQSASRQTSLGSGVLASLIQTGSAVAGSGSQLLQRHNSNPTQQTATGASFEKLAEVNTRYRRWVEAIGREFDNKIDVFCIKIVVAANDREYIVGLRNCSMEFLGNQDNQEEDKRSFVELIISKMNTILPKHQPVSREPSANVTDQQRHLKNNPSGQVGRDNYEYNDDDAEVDDDDDDAAVSVMSSKTVPSSVGHRSSSDKRATFLSQTNVATTSGQQQPLSALRYGQSGDSPKHQPTTTGGQMLNNRNRSVSMNQGEPMRPLNQAEWNNQTNQTSRHNLTGGARPPTHLARRASDRSDSMLTSNDDFSFSQAESPSGLGSSNARQQSLGQSFFDQTSTALSSFQRQSLSFLRRLDTRTGAECMSPSGASGTPPLSAKSDTAFDHSAYGAGGSGAGGSPLDNGRSLGSSSLESRRAPGLAPGTPSSSSSKSRSVDVGGPEQQVSQRPATSSGAHPPPKPPPPASLVNRQSSLANYSSSSIGQQRASLSQHRVRSESSGTTSANSGATITPQNSLNQGSSFSDEQIGQKRTGMNGASAGGSAHKTPAQQQRVIRQNSALSAFEPFDASLRSENYQQDSVGPGSDLATRTGHTTTTTTTATSRQNEAQQAPSGLGRRSSGANVKYDTASMKSANSNTSDETTTAEDTMNNLKKTFASIFGDKCD